MASIMDKLVLKVCKKRAEWALSQMRPFIKEKSRVINIGSGDCVLSEMLERLGHSVTNIDIRDSSVVKQKVIVYDGLKIPLSDKSFDYALLLFVLHHVEKNENLLREAKRVSKKIIILEDDCQGISELLINNLLHLFLRAMPWGRKTKIRKPMHWKNQFKQLGLELKKEKCIEKYLDIVPYGNVLFVVE